MWSYQNSYSRTVDATYTAGIRSFTLSGVKYLPVAINTDCYGQDNTKYRLASAAIKIHYDDVQ